MNFDLLYDNRKYKAACAPYDDIKPFRGDRSKLDAVALEKGVNMFDQEYKRERQRIIDSLGDPRASRE